MDGVPVHDKSGKSRTKKQTGPSIGYVDQVEQQAIRDRQQIGRWDRLVLEDKYLKLQEDNLLLKRHSRKQEEKLKRFAVKLVKLNTDKRKAEAALASTGGAVKKPVRDISGLQDQIEKLEVQLINAEAEKSNLKRDIHILHNQLELAGLKVAGTEVPSRIDSGIKKDGVKRNLRVLGPSTTRGSARTTQVLGSGPGRVPQYAQYGHSLLEEARQANSQLAYEIEQLNLALRKKDSDLDGIREQMRLREAQFDEDILELKRQATGQARSNIQENIDLMRLQREVKDKSTKLTAVQAQFETLNSNLTHMKGSHDALLRQLEDTNSQLKQEQSRVMSLQSKLKRNPPDANRLVELEEQLTDISRENSILKEANENLVNSAFDMEREREWRQRENALKVQIAQLEATLKADLGEKGNILDRLTAEREATERQDKQNRELQREYYKLKEQHDELKEKMKFFTKESAVDFTEIEEALVLVKQRKEREEDNLDFLHKVSDEKNKDMEKSLKVLTADHAETIEELEKTRNMLIVQHQINRDYQQEVDAVNHKMEENKTEYEAKLDEYAQLLDIRAARIRKLESQMKDVAYGTRQYSVKPDDEPSAGSDTEDYDESIQLERGENLFEIHIGKIDLTRDGLKLIGDDEPSLFCTWEFFEFETQATPVVKSSSPRFSFTSQYVVKVDDFFLHHLQKESNILEVHQALGTDYRTIASCNLRFRDIFDKPHGRVHGVADVISLDQNGALALGTLAFWVRLKVPMDQALRLYKERMKALGYININEKAEQTTLQALDETAHLKPPDNVNQLHVKVLRANDVKSRQTDVQPSPYCVYKFFDFPDHDTSIVSSSNSPQFNDLYTFPVTMAADLDAYLKSSQLEVYVFDDTDPELASYLGVAKIPLMALAHDKAINGTFELHQPDGRINGTIDLFLKWQYSYLPPPVGTRTRLQMSVSSPKVKGESLAMMPGESLDANSTSPEPRQGRAARLPPDFHDNLQPMSAASRPQSPPTVIRKSPIKKGKTVEFSEQITVSEDVTDRRGSVVKPSASSEAATVKESELLGREEINGSAQEIVRTDTSAVTAPPESAGVAPPKVVPRVTEPEETAESVTKPSVDTDEDTDVISTAGGATGEAVSGAGDASSHIATSATVSKEEADEDEDTAFDSSITEDIDDDDASLTGTNTQITGNNEAGTYFEESEEESTLADDDPPSAAGNDLLEGNDTGEGNRSEEMSGSDSEGVMIPSAPASRRSLNASLTQEIVVVEVSYLTIKDSAEIMSDPDIKRLFVAYSFLGVAPAELETPISLPKPKNSTQQLAFNFRKVFHVDIEKNYERRQYLASMLLPNSPDNGRIVFTIVCEPPQDDDSADCFDIGVAYASLADVVKTGKNIVDTSIPIYDVDDEQIEIGTLNISIECLAALQAVKEELPEDLR